MLATAQVPAMRNAAPPRDTSAIDRIGEARSHFAKAWVNENTPKQKSSIRDRPEALESSPVYRKLNTSRFSDAGSGELGSQEGVEAAVAEPAAQADEYVRAGGDEIARLWLARLDRLLDHLRDRVGLGG